MADTIAAVATPPGRGGVGILRISGPGAIEAVSKIFKARSKKPLIDQPDRTLVYGTMYGKRGQILDQGLAFVSRAPHSYTGEETAELQCHGSPIVLAELLEALFAQGLRQASPGEFTKRAFLNGKLDLIQAEAVIDLIDAETPAAALSAAGQLEGSLSRLVTEIYDGLVDVMAHFYAVLDYPDEDIDPFREETISEALTKALEKTENLLATWSRGSQLKLGVPTAILGKPNVGKSSLLNALAGYDRAIVTDIPGTTRDTVEERVTLGGVLLRLTDTAGLRDTADPVERLGVERSQQAAQNADLILLMLDGSQPQTREDEAAINLAKEQSDQVICLINKTDLPPAWEIDSLKERFPNSCLVSAKENTGLEQLEQLVQSMFPQAESHGVEVYLTNQRQKDAAARAGESLSRAKESLAAKIPPDLVLTDVEQAIEALGELTGKTMRDDITSRIFQRFCVGK